ncbi:MAG: sigma-54 dependent transcriptional regulator [Myxococcaceae bacterium]|nr:sigma-54 dependent transcriptional regulator [Myxococcaceae bacterium]
MPNARVLLVDDDVDYTYAVSSMLKAGGYLAVVANTASEGVSEARKAVFDVALLDLTLPDADGLAVIDRLNTVDPLLPVICVTGREDTSAVVQGMRRGALDYLRKPVDRATLFNAVNTATEHAAARRGGTPLDGVPMPVGEAPAWRRAMELLSAAAAAPRTTVLLTGEPGVGKEVAAGVLHRLSRRSHAPLVSANAACFSPTLMESELFGHEAGAFTGANKRRKGLFEQADGGFLFLDEIGELQLDLQGRLLRVLEGQTFRRVGGEDPISCDVRLICATNRDLPTQVKKGLFRADLYERLRVFEVPLPPLRTRREDIPHLAAHFVARLGAELGAASSAVLPEALEALVSHSWPGNVRELRNVIERALVLSGGKPIALEHLPHELRGAQAGSGAVVASPSLPDDATLAEAMRTHVTRVFTACDGNLTRAAARLGISRVALRKKLQAYHLKPVHS